MNSARSLQDSSVHLRVKRSRPQCLRCCSVAFGYCGFSLFAKTLQREATRMVSINAKWGGVIAFGLLAGAIEKRWLQRPFMSTQHSRETATPRPSGHIPWNLKQNDQMLMNASIAVVTFALHSIKNVLYARLIGVGRGLFDLHDLAKTRV